MFLSSFVVVNSFVTCGFIGWNDQTVLDSEGNPTTATERVFKTYKNVTQDIRDQLNAEAEAVQIILTGIDNDIYSTIDACLNACEMWKAIERLKQEWQRFVTLVKQSQELKTVSYHKLYDILKQHQHEVNEIRAERIARVANPLALVAQQQPVYHHQNHPTHSLRIPQPDHNKLLPGTEEKQLANQDNSPKINRSDGYENQRLGNVAGAKETKPKWVKDATYHREKMLLCKQEEAGIQLNAEQADWRDDTDDDELEDQELEAHYMYMAKLQEQSISVPDTYHIRQDAHNVTIDSLDMSYGREEIDQNDDDNDLANEQLFPLAPGVYVLEVPAAKELIIGSGIPRSDNGSQERHHVMMIDYLSIVETDKVIYTAKTDTVKLVVEIKCFDMSVDEFDKETGSSNGLQPKQADQSCVHALNEPYLHEIHVVPSKHEADQYSLCTNPEPV
nr:Gag-Pol polyprotein [Tanacetum cinerariifolium]